MRRRSRLAVLGALAAITALGAGGAGAQGRAVEPKIVGGSTTTISQYPWQAALVWSPSVETGNAHQRQFCGGSLVTSRIVITAAHCVVDMGAPEVDVVLGRTDLRTSEGVEMRAQALSFRSNYNDRISPTNDVGYVVLAQASSQPRIQIAGEGEASLWASGANERITGWGCTSPPFLGSCSTSPVLKQATVPIIPDSNCGSGSVYGKEFDSSTMVCAGFLSGGTDTCNGDSGGPLQAPIAGGYRLVGITSWGNGCAQPNAPGVYTRVAGAEIRPLVASDVCALESANGFAHESVIAGVASGASCGSMTRRAASKTKKGNPFAKCKRIHSKKKRKHCVKQVKKKLRKRKLSLA
ncbi:MAG TPA: serine protease [Solirubrobacterales bacterium]|jgi:secreted trypsin-like serine protease